MSNIFPQGSAFPKYSPFYYAPPSPNNDQTETMSDSSPVVNSDFVTRFVGLHCPVKRLPSNFVATTLHFQHSAAQASTKQQDTSSGSAIANMKNRVSQNSANRGTPQLRGLLRAIATPAPEELSTIPEDGWVRPAEFTLANRFIIDQPQTTHAKQFDLKIVNETEQTQQKKSQVEQDSKEKLIVPSMLEKYIRFRPTIGANNALFINGENIGLNYQQYNNVMNHITQLIQTNKEISKKGVSITVDKINLHVRLEGDVLIAWKQLSVSVIEIRLVDIVSGNITKIDETKLQPETSLHIALKNFTTEPDHSLSLNGEKIGLTTQQFQGVMAEASKLLKSSKESLSTTGAIIGNEFYAKLQNGRLTVLKVIKGISSGANGKVHKVVDLVSGIFAALKTAKTLETMSKLKNEVAMLKFIHASGVKPGIQPVPNVELDVNNVVGFTSTLYALDLSTQLKHHYSTLSFPKKMNYINQLLQAAKTLREVGVWHADIKPENIWVAEGDKLLIGDFDGTVTLADAVAKFIFPQSWTYALSQADLVVFIQALGEKDAIKLKEIALAIDLYSISICIFAIITGDYPYKLENLGTLNCYFSSEKLIPHPILSNYKLTVTNFLTNMVDHGRSKRPSLEESIKFWGELTESAALSSERLAIK